MLINKTPNGNDSCCRALSWKPYNCSCMKNRIFCIFLDGRYFFYFYFLRELIVGIVKDWFSCWVSNFLILKKWHLLRFLLNFTASCKAQ